MGKGFLSIELVQNIGFFNEEEVTEETRKIGIELLNKSLKGLSELIDDEELTKLQRSTLYLKIAKMIISSK